ncbi:N-acetyltransferase [Photobacterium makurazakiensis]|uniref:GNAT family N-acetyltransferase n=1 Tax=Photobacterium makurazakiensis TaxID=2910234 RepID=UPI003D0E0576
MLIRTEAPADILPIDALLKSVFETDAEAQLVMKLRENGKRTLSLVACSDEGEILGHLFFSPVTCDGVDDNWQGLAPLAIKAEYQRQGIGQALMEEAKLMLADFGYPVVVVLGHSDYYPKVGFVKASDHGLASTYPVPDEAFMVLELIPNTLGDRTGTIAYCEEFADV